MSSSRRISRRHALLGCALLAFAPVSFAQHAPTAVPKAEEIVQKNAAARGGVEAWRKLNTMAWTGYVESDTASGHKLPFLLEQKRPQKTRFELITDGRRSLRVYDGRSGWKLRINPASGRPELLPYTEDEMRYARGSQVIEGPLMDSVARGATVTLIGQGTVEGRAAHVLDLRLPAGETQRVWVDAETFLELRQDRQVRSSAGQVGSVTVLFREYREFEGVKLPTRIETARGAAASPNVLVIEKVALNPELEDNTFGRPDTPVSRKNSVVVDTRGVLQRGGPTPPPPPRP